MLRRKIKKFLRYSKKKTCKTAHYEGLSKGYDVYKCRDSGQ